MIRAVVTLAPRFDPLDVGGVPCSGEVLLPFPTWPMTDEAPIALDEGTVRRYVPPPPPKPKPFTKKAPAGRWQIGQVAIAPSNCNNPTISKTVIKRAPGGALSHLPT